MTILSKTISRGALTPSQERLWFVQQVEPEANAYNTIAVVAVEGELDSESLLAVVRGLPGRHPALRARFSLVDGELLQTISDHGEIEVEVDRLQAGEGEAEVAAAARRLAEQPFDLGAGPLLRARLLHGADRSYLILVVHHIAVDDWSMRLLWDDLSAGYAATRGEGEMAAAQAPADYLEVIGRHREKAVADSTVALGHWRQELKGFAGQAELPRDRAPGPSPALVGDTLTFSIPSSDARRLEGLAKESHSSLFAALAATWAAVLMRYGNADPVVLATLVANRTSVGDERTVGLFANTVPFVVRPGPEETPRNLMARASSAVLEAIRHQGAPFNEVVKEFDRVGDLGRTPLLQVLFVLEEAGAPSFPGTTSRLLDVADHGAKFDLTLAVRRTPEGGLVADIEYSTAQFDRGTAERIRDHWLAAVRGAASHPDRPLAEIPLLTDGEARIVAATPRSDRSTPYLLPQLARRVAERPGAVALRVGDAAVTYRDLWDRAMLLAGGLQAAGVEPGDLVSVAGVREGGTYASGLAVQMAGAVLVPFDPADPPARTKLILDASDPHLVVVGDEVLAAEALATVRGRRVTVEALLDLGGGRPGAIADVSPASPAYVIFTSGSTGAPKGVVFTRGGLDNYVEWTAGRVESREGARTLQFAPLNFDVSQQEIYSTWCTGGTLVAPSVEERRDMDALAAFIAAESVERIFVPPLVIEGLAEAWELGRAPLPRLREAYVAGDRLHVTDAMRWLFEMTGAGLENHYGPTEAQTVTAFPLSGMPDGWPETPPIGAPVAGQVVNVLSPRGDLVPVGIEGELVVSGPQLARGYLGDAEQTARAFREIEVGGTAPRRAYFTGDHGRWRSDGQLEFRGRDDDQVKVQGYRVELGEVRAALLADPVVADAAVEVVGDLAADRRLVAYVEFKEDEASVTGLRRRMARSLPRYMLPRLVRVKSLPRRPSGKLDRGALADSADPGQPDGVGEDRVAETVIERAVGSAIGEVLGVPALSGGEDFFAAGGHSIAAARAAALLRDSLGLEVAIADIFANPRVEDLARVLDDRAPLTEADRRTKAVDGGLIPLGENQRARLLRRQEALEGGRTFANNLLACFRVRGRMSRSRLEEALADLLDRHDALRAHFRVRDGEFLQVVAPSAEIEVEVWGAEDGSAAIASARRFAERPFELDASPRLRCGLVEVAGEDPFLVLAVDHVVADGWSLALILDELWEGVTGGGPRPRTAGLSYADAMLREEIWLVGPQADKLFQEMTEELDGRSPYPTLTLPSGDDPRARGQGTARFELDFPADRAAALERSAVEASVAPFVLAAAALAEAIVDCGGEASSFATVLANRDSPGTLETVGYFANHGLVHLDADADLDRTRFLSRARDAVERTLRRQRFPFLELVARLDPPHYGTPPSPYLILNFLDGRTGSISARRSAPGLAWEWHEIEGLGFSPGVIALVHRDGPGWTLEFRYDREAYDEAAVRGLAAAWVSAMDGWGGRHAR